MSANQSLVMSQLSELFRDVFEDDSLYMSLETTAKDIEGWDSLMNIRLMFSIEKRFNVHFSASEIAGFQKLEDIVVTIMRKI